MSDILGARAEVPHTVAFPNCRSQLRAQAVFRDSSPDVLQLQLVQLEYSIEPTSDLRSSSVPQGREKEQSMKAEVPDDPSAQTL